MSATLEQVYSGKVKALAGKILRNKGIAVVDADDITQEVAIAHWRDGYDALEWKSANLAKGAIMREKAAKRGGGISVYSLDHALMSDSFQSKALDDSSKDLMLMQRVIDNPLERLAQGESIEAVRNAVSRLPANLQRVVDMRFTQGLTFAQMAFEMTGNHKSVQGVINKLKKAVEILARELARFEE